MKAILLLAAAVVAILLLAPRAVGAAALPPAILAQPLSQTNYSYAVISFAVSAGGTDPLHYQWQKNSANLADGGNIAGSGTDTLVLTNVTAADSGTYSVTITNAAGVTNSADAVLLIYTRLVRNGGFETGDYSQWTRSGNLDDSSSAVGSDHAHSGQYGAVLYPSGSLGYLSQAVPTSSGQPYVISFWLESDYGLTPNGCMVSWDGTNVLELTDVDTALYTQFQVMVTATGTNSLLGFGFRNDPSYFGLDDVSVLPVPRFQSFSSTGTEVSLTWSALAGVRYQLQSNDGLDQAGWSNMGGVVLATNNLVGADDVISPGTERQFYRVLALP